MALGDEAKPNVLSYVALGRETTFGTYASATAAVEFLSCSFKTEIASRKLPAIGYSRAFARRVQLEKSAGGTLETYLHPEETAHIFINAMGGPASTAAGSTGSYIHSITAGNFDSAATCASLSFNVRKGGDSTHTWRYVGGRVNQLRLTAEVGEPVKVSADIVFTDSTQVSDNIAAILSLSTYNPFVFHQGYFRYGATESAAYTTAAASTERIQSFELTINNNLVTDKDAYELGSQVRRVLPATRREVSFKIRQRFDTTTAYARFLQATQSAVDLYFRGASIGANQFQELNIRLPNVRYNSPEPTLDGPDGVVASEISFDVISDNPSTSTGRDISATLRNRLSAF